MTCKFGSNLLPDSGHSRPGLVESQNPWIGGDLAASEMMRKKTGWILGHLDCHHWGFRMFMCIWHLWYNMQIPPKVTQIIPDRPERQVTRGRRWIHPDKKRMGAAIGRCGIEGRCENLPVKGEENIINHPCIFLGLFEHACCESHWTTHQLCRDAWGSSGSRRWVCNCLATLDVDSNPGCWRGNCHLILLTYFSTSVHAYMHAYMWLYGHVCTYMFMYVHTLPYIALHYITLLTYILELCSCYTSRFFSVMKATNQTCTAFKSHSRRVAWSHLAEPWVCGLAHVRGNSLTKMWKATQMGKYRIQNGFLNIDLNLCMIESWKSQSLLIRETLSEFTRDYSRKQFIYLQMSKEARILSGFPRARRGPWGVVRSVFLANGGT